jgi:hypothetical protein
MLRGLRRLFLVLGQFDFLSVNKHSLNLEVVVQKQQISITAWAQSTLAVRDTKHLSRVKGSGFNGFYNGTLGELSEVAHALVNGNGALKKKKKNHAWHHGQ